MLTLPLIDKDGNVLWASQAGDEPENSVRKLPWEKDAIECIDQSGNRLIYQAALAEFTVYGKYRIVFNENKEILWVGRYDDKYFFILSNNQLYALWYEHGKICIKSTVDVEIEYTGKTDDTYLDEIIDKSKPDIDYISKNRKYTYIELGFSKFMDKEFYLRGPKWQPTVEYPNDITVLKEIINCHNGLLNIELENITYPFDAYVVFDIAALQIIEGKTSRDRNLIPDNTSQEKKDDGIFVKIRQIMVDVFGVDENLIEMDKNIVDYSYYIPDYTGLGTGLEAFDLLFSLEECFNIKIPDDEFDDLANSKTIGDLCEYIRKKTIEKGGNAV